MTCAATVQSIPDPTTLTLGEGTDPLVTIKVMNGEQPQNLVGKQLQLVVKATADIADSGALFTLDSAGGSPKITWTTQGAAAGIATADFIGVLTGTGIPGTLFYKVLLIDISSTRKTIVAYGPFVVTNL